VTLSALVKKLNNQKNKLRQLLESEDFVNRPIKPIFKNAKNIQEIMDKQY